MTSQEIRQQFIDFFVKTHGHTFVPSSPVVPLDDPTLLFTNAGMNQFKPIFLGQEKRPYTRAANTQKCIRAGGKHNDLDDVGRSRRHHTFFEMLGNWSFGDYFKAGAIQMAWELLTKVWKLDPTRLHVSCYEGNPTANIPRDTEAADLWKKIANLPDDHIHYFGKDNFWEMGDTGPCGPCTEIYIDRTEGKTGGPQVNGEDPRVMEIWNLVFIQYNRKWTASGEAAVREFDRVQADPLPNENANEARDRVRRANFGTDSRAHWVAQNSVLEVLPAQHVDTGMGLERICQVIQDKSDNYATDLWTPLFNAISEISNLKYTGLFPPTNAADPVAEAANPQLRHDIAFRVIADHVRCLTFALTDGAVPSNEGRGYVLRRILPRAVRFGRQQLELHEPFMHKLVPVIVDSMSGAFPELTKDPQHVIDLVKDEEISFGKTLDRGLALSEQETAQALAVAIKQNHPSFEVTLEHRNSSGRYVDIFVRDPNSSRFWELEIKRGVVFGAAGLDLSHAQISAAAAFKLHDTYGFPIDLTRIMAEERGLTVDIVGYEKLMEQARSIARGVKDLAKGNLFDLPPDALENLAAQGIAPTNDSFKFASEQIDATVQDFWDGNALQSLISESEPHGAAVILDKTNFYSEMGGQIGDSGQLLSKDAIFDVETTKIIGGYILHVGRVRKGVLRTGDPITAIVAVDRRDRTEKNHTSTHLANWALRETLGDTVQQKGSLVDPEKLRFDFSHNKSLTDEELAKVEELVNQEIAKKLPVYAENAPQDQALKINGLRAVFGEKYPPMVRVVSIGAPVKDLLADLTNPKWRQFSIEFCGGTHLKSSDQAEHFLITAEESVSKGIRRIVALTGPAASAANASAKKADTLIAQSKSAPDTDLPQLIAQLNQTISAGTLPLHRKRRAQSAITELQARHKAHEKSQKSQPAKGGAGGAGGTDPLTVAAKLLETAPNIGPGKLIIGEIPSATDDQLRSAIDSLKTKSPTYAILLAAATGEKVTFIAAVSDDLIAKGLKAGDWVKETAKVANGSGGGRPNMAQAGAKDPSKLPDALTAAKAHAQKFA